MYANKKNLAALFGVTTQTVHRRVKGIEKLIGDRYNQYAILDNLVSVAPCMQTMRNIISAWRTSSLKNMFRHSI